MQPAFSDRLSALDATFLDIESATAPMHVGAVMLFDATPLQAEHGGLDMDRLRAYIDSVLDGCPRYRQRLLQVPGLRHPVWIDDDRFNPLFHVRHTRLPLPGTERVLKRTVGRLFSQHLDRAKPMWEFWLIEGLEGNRFALVPKAHHCMVDGVAGVELIQALLRPAPDAPTFDAQSSWKARPVPSFAELLRRELVHRRDRIRALANHRDRLAKDLYGLRNVFTSGLRPAARSSFTAKDLSAFRRFDWTRFSLADAKGMRTALGGTVNDVVVAAVTGAVRRFLVRGGADLRQLKEFRALLPVNIRHTPTADTGNHVAMLLANLPIDEPDAKKRMERVIAMTRRLKGESEQAAGAELIEEIADVTTKALLAQLFRTSARIRTYNLIITNVPGPPIPLYLLGSRLQAVYPMVPLMQNQNVGIALFSYCGSLNFGFNADWESFPELHDFVLDLEASLAELRALARVPRLTQSVRS